MFVQIFYPNQTRLVEADDVIIDYNPPDDHNNHTIKAITILLSRKEGSVYLTEAPNFIFINDNGVFKFDVPYKLDK